MNREIQWKPKEASIFQITQNIYLLNKRGQILLLKHKNGKWLLPGGKLKNAENWQQGLEREIREETSLKIIELKGIFEVDTWRSDNQHYYGIFFFGKATDDNKIFLSQEHIDYKWIDSLEELNHLEMWNQTLKERVQNFLEHSEELKK